MSADTDDKICKAFIDTVTRDATNIIYEIAIPLNIFRILRKRNIITNCRWTGFESACLVGTYIMKDVKCQVWYEKYFKVKENHLTIDFGVPIEVLSDEDYIIKNIIE